VYFGIVNRMIFVELVKVFLMSLVALTGMFLLAGLIQQATSMGLSPGQLAMVIPLIIPSTLPFTIPATTLFATCVVYGRMSADNEVLVLRAAGVNIYHLLWPALALGICTTVTTAILYYDPIPRSQVQLRNQFLRDGETIIYGMIKREGGLHQHNLDFVLFVRDVQGRDLIDVVVKKKKPGQIGQYELVARAQTAKLRIRKVAETVSDVEEVDGEPVKLSAVDRFQRRRGIRGKASRYELVVYMDRCYVDSLRGETAADLAGQEYTTPLPENIFGKDPKERPTAQLWTELFSNREEVINEMAELDTEIKQLEANPNASAGPNKTNADLAQEYRLYTVKSYERQLRQIETEIQMRPALAVGCLVFVLIGCPVGIWASRSDYLSVFIICFLPTMFVYYPMLLASLNLTKDFKVPVYSAWAADVITGVGAIVLIRRLMKR
jgi:lipopolysaccharide export system permease protein